MITYIVFINQKKSDKNNRNIEISPTSNHIKNLELNTTSQNSLHCSISENTDIADKIYKTGRLFDKTKILDNINLNLDLDFQDLYNKQGKEIMKYLMPILDKLKKKETLLDQLTKRARECITEYKNNEEILKKSMEKYKVKKIKLNKFIESLGNLRKEIKDREHQLLEKEKQLLNYEKELNEKHDHFTRDAFKFNNFVEAKSNEMLCKAESYKNEALNVKNFNEILSKKQEEINEKLNDLKKSELVINKKIQTFENEKCDYEIKKREFELIKEEFDIYSGGIIQKYEEIKAFNNKFQEREEKLKEYETELNEKYRENLDKEKRIQFSIQEIEKKNKDINQKHDDIIQREQEIDEIRNLLQSKLDEYFSKIEETEKIQQKLKDKEHILMLKGSIEKEIDLKLTGLELNETLNKKKIANQQKLLNEEISKRLAVNKLAKKIVNGDNIKGNFSKLITVIKGNK